MSVFQVEQYYIHVDITGKTKAGLIEIAELLQEYSCDDYEFCDEYLVVDGFESEGDASTIEDLIESIQ